MITYTALSQSPASAVRVKLNDSCEKSHAATDAASTSVRLLHGLENGAVVDCAPGAAQVDPSVQVGVLGAVSFDQRLACPFLSRQFLKLGDFGAGLETTRFGKRSARDQKVTDKNVVLMT